MARTRPLKTGRLEGPDPVIGDDGLPTTPEPFLPRGWFAWVIGFAVAGCLAGGVYILFIHR